MKAVIVGCGRVGAALADELDRAGWQVLIIDLSTSARSTGCRRRFGGTAIRGDGTDEDSLRRAGAEDADLFLALTEGDNRNVMAAQLAHRGARRPPGRGQDQRPGPRRGVRAPRHRDAVPDEPDDRRDPRLPGPATPGPARRHAPERPASRHGDATQRPADPAGPSATGAGSRVRRGRTPARRPRPMFVLVVGGGKVGYYLTKELIESGHEVVLMEKDRARADQIADEIGSVVIAHDGCEGKYLARGRRQPRRHRGRGHRRRRGQPRHLPDGEAPLRRAADDRPRQQPQERALFRHLGVDEIISPTRMILGSIEQDIPVHELLHLAALGVGELEIIEAHLQRGLAGDRARSRSTSRSPRAARCSA